MTQSTWPDDLVAKGVNAVRGAIARDRLTDEELVEAVLNSSPLGKCLEALEATHLAIKAARNMVPDEDEGLASQVFAQHLNAADIRLIDLLTQIRTVQSND